MKKNNNKKLKKDKILSGENSVINSSNLLDISQSMSKAFENAGAIEPPLDPLKLVRLVSVSNALRQSIETMVTNIHCTGHEFIPRIDLDNESIFDTIKQQIILEREWEIEYRSKLNNDEINDFIEPTNDEVNQRIEALKLQMIRERAKLKYFFNNAAEGISFSRLRKKLGIDQESVGYAAWEIRRNIRGEPRKIKHGPSWTFRALPEMEPITIQTRVQISDIKWEYETENRRFRKFVQVHEGREIYFKEFCDPRVMSAQTGKFYKDRNELLKKEGKDSFEATEIMWFKFDIPESDIYGLCRWSGNVLSVIGSREVEEINLMFFDNKAIPPLAVLVSGGTLAKKSKSSLEKIIRHHIKGKENFHKILILEAEPIKNALPIQGQSGQNSVRIELIPLTEAIFQDQIWGKYDEANRHKIGQSFRVAPLLRGDTKDFNRATANAALEYAEKMVFALERNDFDFQINSQLLPELDIWLWKFKSNGPKIDKTDQVIEHIVKLVETVITPDEARVILSGLLDIELPKFDNDWSKVPLKYALAGYLVSSQTNQDFSERLSKIAKFDELQEFSKSYTKNNNKSHIGDNMDSFVFDDNKKEPQTETIRVSQDTMNQLFEFPEINTINE